MEDTTPLRQRYRTLMGNFVYRSIRCVRQKQIKGVFEVFGFNLTNVVGCALMHSCHYRVFISFVSSRIVVMCHFFVTALVD